MINGEKWFSSHANFASFLIVMAVTDPDAPRHQRASMFVVPTDTQGVDIVRNVGLYGHPIEEGVHSYIRYSNVRVPNRHMLGERGEGFAVTQTRLGGGRIHHAMRTMGLAKRAFDMMCERALSRNTQGETLARKQLVQEMIADSWLQIEQVPPARTLHRLADRSVRRLPYGAGRHLRRQGGDAASAARYRFTRTADPWLARRVQ